MTTEEMKEAWAETSRRIDRLERNQERMRIEGINSSRRTALDNLALRYRRFSTLSLVCAIITPLQGFSHIYEGVYRIWLPLTLAVYFGIASAMDWWLYLRVKSIDVTIMPAEEVTALAAHCKKVHFIDMAVLIPMMIGVLALFCLAMQGEVWGLYGIAFGFIVGLILGIRQFMNFMEDYRMLGRD